MRFNTSLSQVTNWLQDNRTQFQQFETSVKKSETATKRPRSSTSKHSHRSKRRQLLSPPASQDQGDLSIEMESEPATILTPKKRPADDPESLNQENDTNQDYDNDQTPRGDPNQGKSRTMRKAPSISSRASSTYSRDSKRSKGSQSPIKMWPLIGPNGHKLMRTNPLAHPSPAVQNLIDEFAQIDRGRSIIPRSIRQTLQDMDVGGLDDGMFFDNDFVTDGPCSKDLVRYVQRIAKHSNTCSSQLQDEGAWNNLVHSRVLDLFVHDMNDGPGQDICDFMPCITTNMNLSYHRFNEPSSRVDYIVRMFPESQDEMEDDGSPEWLTPNRMPSLNWTTNQLLPIAFSIETKRYGGDVSKAEQQLGIWNAAQWEFLISTAGAQAVKELDFIPGVVVYGEIWSLVITTRNQLRTNVFPGIPFGNTRSIIGVFQVIAGLRRLRKWVLEKLWPWYQKYLAGLVQHSEEQRVDATNGGENQDMGS